MEFNNEIYKIVKLVNKLIIIKNHLTNLKQFKIVKIIYYSNPIKLSNNKKMYNSFFNKVKKHYFFSKLHFK